MIKKAKQGSLRVYKMLTFCVEMTQYCIILKMVNFTAQGLCNPDELMLGVRKVENELFGCFLNYV